ncbi:oxidoreductase, aldo/keto reductase family protein [Oceanicola granulosus HTCC2516]|uniref:Oxidoreductase, aldo/keto reductase family protein n=1 Tax=Oceanicola granulosus (strain ATCC BAA-861 / DSM 15982 / KCTC 12143 / HTCC2516) TaxID=314256 RepID=Q2CD96_OCEGH|nr:aldo/keto reductase [Oceanicola granulosus]EAR50694.1 oxidoreductase, aldo/keto reductase family protein [Oceanicola granulosus HTCC2516]
MKTLELGRSGIEVTDWCLGTMTYGNQTDEADAHAQIERAREAGIDFMDCAEMYPVNPVRAETVGRSEEVLGNWFARSKRRDEWIVATKVSGSNGGFVRGGKGYDGATIRETVEASLRRLRTDRIDLYQLHWPERGTYAFRKNWGYDPSGQDSAEVEAHMLDVLAAMDDVIKAGKVRAFGLSNETCWGTMRWIRLAEENGLPRVAAVQNEYSLLNRLWDTDMAEMSVHEDVTLLPYSPLGAGLLTGKYQNGQVPAGSRMEGNGDLGGRKTDRAFAAIDAYLAIAARHGLEPVHMALAWQRTRPFPLSAIFGATSLAQLEHILAGDGLTLAPEVVEEIEAAHKAHPMPY